ncbi:MAG TPA: ABC transporter ATP-binding protein [Longimicrobiales bacterium]
MRARTNGMIEFEGVTKTYGPARSRPALADVTVAVPRGSVWAVVGPNGAGKTTLFGLLLGFLHPTAGRVRIDGRAPRRYLRARGAAYLPERFRLPDGWTVAAALRALARLEGMGAAAARARADALLERFALGAHAGKPVQALSRGLLQRVGVAQALLAPRELVVLDEPTEGLDPLWRIRFRAVVDELRAEGRTVLLASHDLAEVERTADRVVLLEAGRVRDVLDVSRAPDAAQRYRLALAAPTPAVVEAFPGAAVEPGEDDVVYTVTVADAAELSDRLAALLAAGGIVSAVAPAAEPLEARVRRALSGGAE